MKRFLLLVLSMVLLASSMVACNGDAGSGNGTTSDSVYGSISASISASGSVSNALSGTASSSENSSSQPQGDGEPEEKTTISVAEFKQYKIIRPEGTLPAAVSTALNNMIGAISTKLGVTLDIGDDFLSPNPSRPNAIVEKDMEIVIGDCNRAVCDGYYGVALRRLDYGYTMDGTKLVIYGGSADAIASAINRFVTNVINAADTSDSAVIYNKLTNRYFQAGSYQVENLTINNTSIAEYRIIYPNTSNLFELQMATKLRDHIAEISGYILPLEKDTTAYNGEKEIRFGKTFRDTDYIVSNGIANDRYMIRDVSGSVLAYAPTAAGIVKAADALLAAFSATKATDKSLNVQVGTDTAATQFTVNGLRVMSFNVYTGNVTETRKQRVRDTINKYAPDILGVQEANPTWMTYLKSVLTDYGCVGTGRDGGSSGEYTAIFYNKSKYTLLESGTKWLSGTPDQVSKVEGSICNRIFTYALLKDNATNETFLYINTHLDHTSEAVVRNEQVGHLMNFIKNYSNQYKVILTGDLNASASSEAIKALIGGGFDNSSTIAAKAEIATTSDGGNVIDYIMISKNTAYVSSYVTILDQFNGEYPSDHRPIIADLFWK